MSEQTEGVSVPQLPERLRKPEPVIVAGMLLWLAATIVVWLTGWGPDRALTVCLVGLLVGVLGTGVVFIQKAAVNRGSKMAQQGLDPD